MFTYHVILHFYVTYLLLRHWKEKTPHRRSFAEKRVKESAFCEIYVDAPLPLLFHSSTSSFLSGTRPEMGYRGWKIKVLSEAKLKLFKVLSFKPVIFHSIALHASPAGRKICHSKYFGSFVVILSEVLFIPLCNGVRHEQWIRQCLCSDAFCVALVWPSRLAERNRSTAERSRTMGTSLRGFARRYLQQRWNLGQSPVRERAGRTIRFYWPPTSSASRDQSRRRRGRALALENQAWMGANSKNWFTTSFLQPLPYLVTP